MRLAIFSDVHGNLSGLEAVLSHIQQQHVDRIFCAGDICAFGPRPKECLELIQQMNIPAVVGNTDEWIRNPPPVSPEMNDEQKEARKHLQQWCSWTAAQLANADLEQIDILRQIFERRISPSDNVADDLLLVHANPNDLLQVIYPPEEKQMALFGRLRQSDSDLEPLVGAVKAGVLAFGHIHMPNIRKWRDLMLVNVSSVSLPADGDDRAKYAVLSWSKDSGWQARHHFVDFEVEDEISAYRQHKPPGWEHRVKKLETAGLIHQKI